MSSRHLRHQQTVARREEPGANLRPEYDGKSLDALSQMTALDMGLTRSVGLVQAQDS